VPDDPGDLEPVVTSLVMLARGLLAAPCAALVAGCTVMQGGPSAGREAGPWQEIDHRSDAREISEVGPVDTLSLAVAGVEGGFLVTWATQVLDETTVHVRALDEAGRPRGPSEIAERSQHHAGIYPSLTRCGPDWLLRHRLTQSGAFVSADGHVISRFDSTGQSPCPGTFTRPPEPGHPSAPLSFAVPAEEMGRAWREYWLHRLDETRPPDLPARKRPPHTWPVPWREAPLTVARAQSTYLLVWSVSALGEVPDAGVVPAPEPPRRPGDLFRPQPRRRGIQRPSESRVVAARVTEKGEVLGRDGAALELGMPKASDPEVAASDRGFLLLWHGDKHLEAAFIDAESGAVDALGTILERGSPMSLASDGERFAMAVWEPKRIVLRYPIGGRTTHLLAAAPWPEVWGPRVGCARGRCLTVYVEGSGAEARVMGVVVTAGP
jgi:hypothetical protein